MPELKPKLEPLYTVEELAERLKVSHMTIRRMFQDRPGVLKLGGRNRKNKRDWVRLRIPESVVAKAVEQWQR